MATYPMRLLRVLSISCLLLVSRYPVSARILTQCEAAKELVRAGAERSFISTYVCIMKSESGFNTSLRTGPGHKSSFSYGIFQINSERWCNQFRPGGVCNKKCTDFLNDDIQDDIACARIIQRVEGFKNWKKFEKNCKKMGQLPNISGCIIRRDLSEEGLVDEIENDEDNLLEDEQLDQIVPDQF